MDKKGFKVDEGLVWAGRIIGKKKAYIWILAAANGIGSAAAVCFAMLMRDLIDSATSGNKELLIKNTILLVSIVFLQVAVIALTNWLGEFSRTRYENTFKKKLFHEILTKDFTQIKNVHSAEWVNRLSTDTAVVADGYVDIFPGLIGMSLKLIFAVYMIIKMDSRFAILILPGIVLVMFFSYVFRSHLKKLHKDVRDKDGALRVFFQERISSLMVVRSFSAEGKTEEMAQEKMNEHLKSRMSRNRFSNICRSGFSIAIQGLYLCGLIYCSYRIFKGSMTFGTLAAITQLISQIQSPFANITGYLPRYYALLASADRLKEIEGYNDEALDGDFKFEDVKDFYSGRFESVSLKNVDFTYTPAADDDKDNLPASVSNVSLHINKDEYVAFTGESGCGKSTVLKLIMALYKPDNGDCIIRFDGKDEVLSSKYRKLFAYVPQGNMLMNGSIKEIVSFSSDDADTDRIKQALRIACAEEFVSKLPEGLDTTVIENGSGFSEGQMQRLAIARAIYSEHPILLLDECTSALDSETEEMLLKNLRTLPGRTVIIVTHRPAALKICDRVLKFTKQGIIENER